MALGKESVLFLSVSGDFNVVFHEGAEAAGAGGIWMLDMKKPLESSPVRLYINNFPSYMLYGHGLYVSNKTDRLYVVNHKGPQSVVEVLSIEYSPVRLTYITTVDSYLFPRYGINDVAEGINEDELYVTEWLPYSTPEHGKSNPESEVDRLQSIVSDLFAMNSVLITSVYRCDVKQNICENASKTKFLGGPLNIYT